MDMIEAFNPEPAPRRRVSSLERMRTLPEVFSTQDVMAYCEVTRSHADTMVREWRGKDLITSLGARKAGVHFNLIRNPAGPLILLNEAMWVLTRRPTLLVGGMALRAGEWTTQLHRKHEVAMGVTTRLPTVPTGLDGVSVNVMPRPAVWMHELLNDAERHDTVGSGGFPTVSPAMALADSVLAHARGVGPQVNAPLPWLPDPDDLEIPDEEAFDAVRECMTKLRADGNEMQLIEGYRDSVFTSGTTWKR